MPDDDALPGVHPAPNIQRTPDVDEVEEFWHAQGFALTRVPSRWEFSSRRDLEDVVRIEFPPALAEELLAEHSGTVVDCHYALCWTRI